MELRQKAIDSGAFARSAEDPNPNLTKSIRHSASARRDGPRRELSIVSGPGRQWLTGYDLIFRVESFANIHDVREGSPITRRRLHTSVRKTLLSYYSEEEATEIVEAAKKLRMSISSFIASAALKEAEVTNSKRRKSH
jgi:hypothetical protein